MVKEMDAWLSDYAKLVSAKYKSADAEYPGTGAAGGMGFAFLAYTNAVLESGIKIILEETKLEDYVKDADIVITGEGRLDGQTVFGKAPIGVAKIAKKYDKPVLAFAGAVTEGAVACNEEGIDAFFPIVRGVATLEEAMNPVNARKNMAATVEQVFRML
jgi:glycerate kinase